MLDILIPAYNCTKTIATTLESLINQNNYEFNVIIYDDGSTEDIYPEIEPFEDTLSITYIKGEQNLGVGAARQKLIDNSKSKFFTFLDADDILLPNAVEIFYKYAADIKYNNIDIFIADIQAESKEGSLSTISTPFKLCFTHAKFYKREFIDKYKIISVPDVYVVDDMCFSFKTLELGKILNINESIYIWKYNANSVTRGHDNTNKYAPNLAKCCYEILRFITCTDTTKKFSTYRHMNYYLAQIKKLSTSDLSRLSKEAQDEVQLYTNKFMTLYNHLKKTRR